MDITLIVLLALSGVGMILGAVSHFRDFKDKVPKKEPIEPYVAKPSRRSYSEMRTRLLNAGWKEYSHGVFTCDRRVHVRPHQLH